MLIKWWFSFSQHCYPRQCFLLFFLLSKLSCLLVIDRRVHCEHSSGLLSTRAGWDYFWPNFADSKSYTCRLRNSVLLLGFYILSASKFQSVDYLFINIPVCFCVFVEMLLCSFLKCPMFWFHMVTSPWAQPEHIMGKVQNLLREWGWF